MLEGDLEGSNSEVQLVQQGPWEVVVKSYEDGSDSSAGNTSEEEEDELRAREQLFVHGEVPSEYWHIQKLIKYMKTGNQTATLVALCCLKDHDLVQEYNHAAIQVWQHRALIIFLFAYQLNVNLCINI